MAFSTFVFCLLLFALLSVKASGDTKKDVSTTKEVKKPKLDALGQAAVDLKAVQLERVLLTAQAEKLNVGASMVDFNV